MAAPVPGPKISSTSWRASGVVAVDDVAVVGDVGDALGPEESAAAPRGHGVGELAAVDHAVEVDHGLIGEGAERAGVPGGDDGVLGQVGADPAPGVPIGFLDRAEVGVEELRGQEQEPAQQGEQEDGLHGPQRGSAFRGRSVEQVGAAVDEQGQGIEDQGGEVPEPLLGREQRVVADQADAERYVPAGCGQEAGEATEALAGPEASQLAADETGQRGDDQHGDGEGRGRVHPLDVTADLHQAPEGDQVGGHVDDGGDGGGGHQLHQAAHARRRPGGGRRARPRRRRSGSGGRRRSGPGRPGRGALRSVGGPSGPGHPGRGRRPGSAAAHRPARPGPTRARCRRSGARRGWRRRARPRRPGRARGVGLGGRRRTTAPIQQPRAMASWARMAAVPSRPTRRGSTQTACQAGWYPLVALMVSKVDPCPWARFRPISP